MSNQNLVAALVGVVVAAGGCAGTAHAQGLLGLLGVQSQEAAPAAAPAPAEAAGGGGLWGALGGAWSRVQGLKQELKPTDQERSAFQHIHGMLEPNKLGGADRTFNQNDIPPIVQSLLGDPSVQGQIRQGIRDEAFNQAGQVRVPILRGVAQGIADRRTTPGTRGYRQHYGEYWAQGVATAAERIRGELATALDADGISPAPGQGPSSVPRDVTLAELDQFKGSVATLRGYSDRVADRLGFRSDLPRGLSQVDMQAIMDGQSPPNGVIRRPGGTVPAVGPVCGSSFQQCPGLPCEALGGGGVD